MNNEEVRLECSPKLVKGHSEVNCAHPPLVVALILLNILSNNNNTVHDSSIK